MTGLTTAVRDLPPLGWRRRPSAAGARTGPPPTAQYERLGGIEGFLRRYLHECLTVGYNAAPMKREADEVSRRVCDG